MKAPAFLAQRVAPALAALSENNYMSAIRAGMVSVVPLTIIGGLFMVVLHLPIAQWEVSVARFLHLLRAPSIVIFSLLVAFACFAVVCDFKKQLAVRLATIGGLFALMSHFPIASHLPLLQIPVTATFGLLGLFVCFAIAYDFGKRLKQEAVNSAMMASLVFLLIQVQPADQSLSMDGLGSKGLFTGVIIALLTVRVQKFFNDRNWVVKLPENVPSVVYESFLSLSPLVFLVLVFWAIRFILGVDINHVVQTAFKPLVFALNTLPGILVYAFLVTMLWSVGINGDNALDAIVAPIFLQYLAANVEAMAAGQPLPYITANGFFTTFVNVGGTGATIALALIMWNSKEPGFRKVSRLSLPTQIFQINEPIFFGFPIVLNPIFMAPYVMSALILTTGSYLLMDWGVLQRPFVNVPWTTPPIIGHYLVSGGDWKAAVWGAASIVIAMAVYYPFAKAAERQRLRDAAAAESAKAEQ